MTQKKTSTGAQTAKAATTPAQLKALATAQKMANDAMEDARQSAMAAVDAAHAQAEEAVRAAVSSAPDWTLDS